MKTNNIQFLKQSEFHLRHLGKDLSQARPLFKRQMCPIVFA